MESSIPKRIWFFWSLGDSGEESAVEDLAETSETTGANWGESGEFSEKDKGDDVWNISLGGAFSSLDWFSDTSVNVRKTIKPIVRRIIAAKLKKEAFNVFSYKLWNEEGALLKAPSKIHI